MAAKPALFQRLPPNTAALTALQQWQLLSPIALLYFGLRLLKGLLGNSFYLLPTVVLIYRGVNESPLTAIAVVFGLLVLIMLLALLKYYSYRFRVTDETVDIQSGVIRKNLLSLPFERIQNVTLEQPWYYRFSQHVVLRLDTAGSQKQEATLIALPRSQAEALQQLIYATHQPDTFLAEHSQNEAVPSLPDETLLNRRSLWDLIVYGATNNRIWFFLAVTAPFWQWLPDQLLEENLQDINAAHWLDLIQAHWLWFSVVALGLLAALVLVLVAFSIIGTLLTYYDYTLVRLDDRYIQRSGLLNRHEVSMKMSRLQWIRFKQDWLNRLFKRGNLHFEPLKAVVENAQTSSRQIMVPALPQTESVALMNDVFPQQQLHTIQFTAINWRYLLRLFGLVWLPLVLLTQGLLPWFEPTWAKLALLPLVVLVPLLVLRWWRWGYAWDEHYLYVRKGWLGLEYYCVPIYKVQQVGYAQTPLMRRAGLCDVQLVFAAGSLTLPFISEQDGCCLVNEALYQAESSGRSWM